MNGYQVVVIGGGPAGLTCALSLSSLDSSLKIVVLERNKREDYRPGEHLAVGAIQLLSDLGIGQEAFSSSSEACWEISSQWGDENIRPHDSILDIHGPGLVVSRPHFDRLLAEHATKRGIEVRSDIIGNKSYRTNKGWCVGTRSTKCDGVLECNFIVDASGRSSRIATSFGVKPVAYDRLVGFTMFADRSVDDVLCGQIHIEAVEDGWWYSAVQLDKLVITFMTDADLVRRSGQKLGKFWHKAIEQAPTTLSRLANHRSNSTVYSRPAHTQCLNQIGGGGWLAIGDAASSYDPLSSRGIFKGIADGILAAPAILNSISGDKDQLQNFCLNIQSRFKQYLQERRMFYLSEQRWPKSMFWQRRQKRVWPDYSIWLDPDHRLPNLRMPQRADLSQIKDVSPAVDFPELIRLAADAKCAREAVSAYREVCDSCSDQEIIVALQHLLLSAE